MVSEDQTQALALTKQALYQPPYLPSCRPASKKIDKEFEQHNTVTGTKKSLKFFTEGAGEIFFFFCC